MWLTSGRRSIKPRLHCTQAGCRSTFPRPYELKRHVQNVHQRSVTVTCPVYGCSRAWKPFSRLDKLREHFKKHDSPSNFLCLFPVCTMGAFSLGDLANHLISVHMHEHSQANHLYEVMRIISWDTLGGRVLFEVAAAQQNGNDICPLMSRGCNFRLSVRKPLMIFHIQTHDLIDRLKLYGDLVEYHKDNTLLLNGSVSCPMCPNRQTPKERLSLCYFLKHITIDHSKEDRQRFLREYPMLCETILL